MVRVARIGVLALLAGLIAATQALASNDPRILQFAIKYAF